MADVLLVYRRFYRISAAPDLSTTYTLIDPYALTATVRNVSQGNITVEASASTVNTTVGVYYADLVASLYNSDDEYEVEWSVVYVNNTPQKNLYTRFRFPSDSSIGGDVNVVYELNYEMINPLPLSFSVSSHALSYSIEPTP